MDISTSRLKDPPQLSNFLSNDFTELGHVIDTNPNKVM